MPITLTSSNFDTEVSGNMPMLVDFWASWCAPCRRLAPTIDALEKDYEGKVKVGKVNVDENKDLAVKFNIMSIPAVIIFKDGKSAETLMGNQAINIYKEALDKILTDV